MNYPNNQSLAQIILKGLRQVQQRNDQLESDVAAEVAKLPPAAQASLTSDAIFANAALLAPSTQDLRTMTRNPGFKIEPAISELRRAESCYIRAHDAYLADKSGAGLDEMRWAFARLQIARQFYEGLVTSLPTAKRQPDPSRPVTKTSAAIKRIKLSDFDGESQHALRQAIVDPAKAVAQIDLIIQGGNAPRGLRLLHAYLIDPKKVALVTAWLVNEIEAGRVVSAESLEIVDDNAATEARMAPIAPQPVAATERSTHCPVINEEDEAATEPAILQAINTIDAWLRDMPRFLDNFTKIGDYWEFGGTIHAKKYAAAYALASRHPKFQQMIERNKSAAG